VGKNTKIQAITTALVLLCLYFIVPAVFAQEHRDGYSEPEGIVIQDASLIAQKNGVLGKLDNLLSEFESSSGALFRNSTLGIVLLVSTFIILLFLLTAPLAPGIIELLKPKDLSAPFVDVKYIKDPRYFERSFLALLNAALGPKPKTGTHEVKLSRMEKIDVSFSKACLRTQLHKTLSM